ncbi:Y+L amino acid transporter 2-like [Platysternon megacephalum]|uniref:Y+L amino acid transporter 2-like n=1 Tax=Platysternon megacephalum TaxID=55544 RepID=A0A4D9EW99_9SAUR|nr:Y+L amino acid transporter 2-like [Platysternon megacephalum]
MPRDLVDWAPSKPRPRPFRGWLQPAEGEEDGTRQPRGRAPLLGEAGGAAAAQPGEEGDEPPHRAAAAAPPGETQRRPRQPPHAAASSPRSGSGSDSSPASGFLLRLPPSRSPGPARAAPLPSPPGPDQGDG